MNALSIAGLGKSYGPVKALDAIDLDIPSGSRTAVVGPSGSGKTTLLRLIAGFERPDAGAIAMDGVRIADPARGVPPHRLNIGLVMQEGALFPHLSVRENIGFGMPRQEDRIARIDELIRQVDLDPSLAGRQPHQLSGGQQQRVALARALARRPRLMLLDEPFSALDSGLRDQLRQTAGKILSEAEITTILVTHDRDEAMTFADQLVILREGRLVQKGPPRDLYLAPVDPLTAEFLGQAIILDATVADGQAQSSLGTLLLAHECPPGPAKVMLRPEQLRLEAHRPDAPNGTGRGRVVALEEIGPTARVTLAIDPPAPALSGLPPAMEISFALDNRDPPPLGAAVSIGVAGKAHRFSP
jgi:iron(III) transport system ATP-binding protein